MIRFKPANILLDGFILGIALSLCNSSISAEREVFNPAEVEDAHSLPFEQLRSFSEVYTRIKRDYADPVADKKLFADAVRGMLSGLDPRPDPCRDCKTHTRRSGK